MKIFAVVFGFLVASVCSHSHQEREIEVVGPEQRLVTNAVANAIEDLRQSIREAGLDPLHIEREDYGYDLPVPEVFTSSAHVEDVRSNGLSNIVINSLSFGIITTRLNFDLGIPRIDASVGSAAGEAIALGYKFNGQGSGRVAINGIRVNGNVRVSIGIISGVSIRDLNINFSLAGIESDLNLDLLGVNLSSEVNTLLADTLPALLLEFRAEINQLLEIIALQYIEDLL